MGNPFRRRKLIHPKKSLKKKGTKKKQSERKPIVLPESYLKEKLGAANRGINYRKVMGTPKGNQMLKAELRKCYKKLEKSSEKEADLSRQYGGFEKIPTGVLAVVRIQERFWVEHKKMLEKEALRLRKEAAEKKPIAKKTEEKEPTKIRRLKDFVKDEWKKHKTLKENCEYIASITGASEDSIRNTASALNLKYRQK